jgi:hypothetical protein
LAGLRRTTVLEAARCIAAQSGDNEPLRPEDLLGGHGRAAGNKAHLVRQRPELSAERKADLMKDLSVLTPPLLMGAVVVVAVVAFLRHEMRRSRSAREDQAAGISPGGQFEDDDLDSASGGHGAATAADDS